jgi:protein-S-isoprenylcysteine O-methyltransferase Ste14
MKKIKNDNPGVILPPPLIYAIIFLTSVFLNKILPVNINFIPESIKHRAGPILIGISLALLVTSLWRFFKSRNTLITIRPASSLQTTGIYAYTRNPMYLSLVILYAGIAFFKGNLWTFSLIPVLMLVIEYYVIKREELYLERQYGEEFVSYKNSVRRWL